MNIICPCCNSQMPDFGIDKLLYLNLSENEESLIDLLVTRYPRPVSVDSALTWLYAFKEEPENAYRVVIVMVSFLQPKLKKYGWKITNTRNGQAQKAQYVLEKVKDNEVL